MQVSLYLAEKPASLCPVAPLELSTLPTFWLGTEIKKAQARIDLNYAVFHKLWVVNKTYKIAPLKPFGGRGRGRRGILYEVLPFLKQSVC